MKKRLCRALVSSLCCALSMGAMESDGSDKLQKLSVRIMSYNIRRDGPEKDENHLWVKRLPLVKGLIERLNLNPDIMGLQEATKNQIDDLLPTLQKFSFVGEGRGSSWAGWGADEYNPIMYDGAKFELLEHKTFSINKSKSSWGWTPLQAQSTGLLPRICTKAKFKEKGTGREFWVYNTHLDNGYQTARLNQLRLITRNIRRQGDSSVIFMGDFNMELGSGSDQEVKDAIKGLHLAQDATHNEHGVYNTRTGWDGQDCKEIDFILFNDPLEIKVDRYEVVEGKDGEYPSDHRPVVADFTIGGDILE